MTCPNDAWYATPANCAPVIPLPVKVTRTIAQNHDGLMSTVTDRYESTDGSNHTISVGYWQSFCISPGCSDHLTYTLPAGGTLADPSSDVVTDVPDGSTLGVRDPSKADGAVDSGRGAITVSPGADSIAWDGTRWPLYSWNNRSVPAGGSFTVVGRFVQAIDSSTLDGLTAAAVSGGGTQAGPQPSIAPSPAAIQSSGKATAKYNKKKKTITITTGKKVSCPPGGGSCTVSVTLGAKYKKGKKTKTYKLKSTQTISAGAIAGIVIAAKVKNNPLYTGHGSAGSNPLHKSDRFVGTLTATAAGATPTSSKLSLKLKLPKIPKKK
jgi:hypothetical protein